MKYFLYSGSLIALAIFISSLVPFITGFGEEALVGTQAKIPQNNSQIAGVQKYLVPPISHNLPAPMLSARAVLVKDLQTDTILLEKQAQLRVPIASTTKIMTSLVASEYFKPNSPLTVQNGVNVPGAKVGFYRGESLSFRSLLYGMLLSSGNDAAYAIAENYPGGVIEFVSAMNKKAAELHLSNTNFDNPAGFDSPNHFSSAEDLAKITEETLKDNQLTRIFATQETEVISLDRSKRHSLHNLNKLLASVAGVLGVKTGYTTAAKENLIGLIEREGRKVLTIVLGSDDRFGETASLIDWTFKNFNWQD